MHPTLSIAVKAARRAGAVITRASRDIEGLTVSRKSHNDFVTEVDKAAEEAIIGILAQAFPDHAILAEESGLKGAADAEYTWIIDPLDGTTNFIHGFPQYAVSIGLRHKDLITQAVVYDPERNELFTASRGGGEFLNDRRIRVSKRNELAEALLATGFPSRKFDRMTEFMAIFRELSVKTNGIRRAGAASLDLAWVAAGRLDGFWETGLAPWDIAAGSLLIQEAGGLVSDLNGNATFMETGRIAGGTPRIFAQLLQVIAPHLRA